MKYFVVIFLLLISSVSLCEQFLVVGSTNDLHSHYDYSASSEEEGGYGRIYSALENQKAQASKNGHYYLRLDAGDFEEGNLFFMSDGGKTSYRLLDQMGVEASTLGNHDYMMGPGALDKLIASERADFPLLVSNIMIPDRYPNLKQKVKPYMIKHYGDKKVAIIGVTDANPVYACNFEDVMLTNPRFAIERVLSRLNNGPDKPDFVIVLSHLGKNNSLKLAQRVEGIDLIVDGHSHTPFEEGVLITRKRGGQTVVTQADAFGNRIGKTVINLDKREVVSVELEETKDFLKDSNIEHTIRNANEMLNVRYGKEYLDEIVGYSPLTPESRHANLIWDDFIADAVREAADTDIGFTALKVAGERIPTGGVTRRQLFNGFPRFFDITQKMGWGIEIVKVKPWFIKNLFKYSMYHQMPFAFSGVEFTHKWSEKKGEYIISDIRINGEPLKMFKTYTLAMPDGFLDSAKRMSPLVGTIVDAIVTPARRQLDLSVIEALEQKFKRDNVLNIEPFYLHKLFDPYFGPRAMPVSRPFSSSCKDILSFLISQ